MKMKMNPTLLATAIATLLLGGCGGVPKSQSLLDAEIAYGDAKVDAEVLRHAPSELERAHAVLERAAIAKEKADMESLAYVGRTRVEIARTVTERKLAQAKLEELGKIKGKIQLELREAETQHALQQREAAVEEKERAVAQARLLQDELSALQAQKTDRGMVLTLGDVLFETGKAKLLAGAMDTIRRLASFMNQYPDKRLLIEGHTDDVGSKSYNQWLSEERSNSVRNALVAAGVAEHRIDTIGYGEEKPIADNGSDAGRMKNRRVEIVIRDAQ